MKTLIKLNLFLDDLIQFGPKPGSRPGYGHRNKGGSSIECVNCGAVF